MLRADGPGGARRDQEAGARRSDTVEPTTIERGPRLAQGIVHVLDDDLQLLDMLRGLIESIGCEARCFSDARAFLQGYDHPCPRECLLCDIRMPGMSGLQLQRCLQEREARIPVIFLTGFADIAVAVEAMKHGAFDFIQKPFSIQALLDRVNDALGENEKRYEQRLRESAITARIASLTPQERNIAALVVAGRSSPVIARNLGLSQRTVENHRASILSKLHLHSTAELIRLMLAQDPGLSGSQGS
jgi:FixJ family two-component response regulator